MILARSCARVWSYVKKIHSFLETWNSAFDQKTTQLPRKHIKLNHTTHAMFVVMADIQLRNGIEDDFKAWFSESNQALSKFPGFISRRLLKSGNNNSYRVIVEHETRESFIHMHGSPEHQKVHPVGRSFMTSDPVREMFSVVVAK